MIAAVGLLLLVAMLCAIGYAMDCRNMLALERIRRQEADDWAAHFEAEAETLRCENARLSEQVATLQMLYAERTRDLLAHNYRIIETNVAWKRRRQQ